MAEMGEQSEDYEEITVVQQKLPGGAAPAAQVSLPVQRQHGDRARLASFRAVAILRN
jgi:hypothetical protein